jgi:putative RecB family exonuclease
VAPVDGGTQLGFELELERLVRVTPARLGVWDDCPRRFRLAYLDRPAPPRGGPQAANTLGAVVHLALRALYERPAAARTAAAAAALVDRYWSSEGFRDERQASAYRARARDWVADYVTDELHRTEPDEEPAVGLEQWVSVRTGRLVVEGRVDRIDRRGDELVIVDYKTGRRMPTPADAAASPALALYAVAAERTLRRSCRQVELHHLPTGEVAGWRHDDASLAAHLRRAETSAAELAAASDALGAGADPGRMAPGRPPAGAHPDALEAGVGPDALFPARPAPRCSGCPMRRSCPEGQAVGPPAASWVMLVP